MIVQVDDAKKLKKFILYVKDLYKGCEQYAPQLLLAQKKELESYIIDKEIYKAIYCERNGEIMGRLMYTIAEDPFKNENVCYFSMFDAINDATVVKELLDYMENAVRFKVKYIVGPVLPAAVDLYRGIMVRGFSEPHSIFLSYNYSYYADLLEKQEYIKYYDMVGIHQSMATKQYNKICKELDDFKIVDKIHIDNFDMANADRDLEDIKKIFKETMYDFEYQDTPSIELISYILKYKKQYIEPNLIKIARDNETNKAVGLNFMIFDYNETLKKTKGHIRPLYQFLTKHRHKNVRSVFSYVIPDYQNIGVLHMLHKASLDTIKKYKVNYFECGTMMEKNLNLIRNQTRFGGEISKVFRVFIKTL